MLNDDKMQALVRLIYEAALDPAVWNVFLDEFSLAVGGSSSALVAYDFGNSNGSVAVSVGVDPHWEKLYAEHYGQTNIWTKNARALLMPGVVAQSQQSTTDEELERSEFYNDYLRYQNFFYSAGGTFGKEGAVVSYLTTLRSRQAGAFGEGEMAVLRYLMPHLDCALRVHSHISGLEQRLSSSASALDLVPWGVVLMDGQRRPLLLNRGAQDIFAQRDGLNLTRAGLVAATRASTEEIQRLVASAQGGSMVVPRPSQRRGYEVRIVPLPVHMRLADAPSAVVAVFISDPEGHQPTEPEILQTLYRLTKGEARVAGALLRGETIEEAAQEFGVSLHTVRDQLKSILTKTQTHRQSELVRLLMSGLARLRGSAD